MNAMEVVEKVRKEAVPGHSLSMHYFSLTDTEAAALIEEYGRRVPRAYEDDIYDAGHYEARNLPHDSVSQIRAKYGVEVEG